MNYQKVYDQICDRGKTREKVDGVYYEQHHITPRCMGGDDSPENLVNLTAREHFICHWLLARIYTNNQSLAHAFWMMCKQNNKYQQRYKPSSKIYAEARELAIIAISKNNKVIRLGIKHSEETKRKISKSHKGKIKSEKHKQNISQSKIGKRLSEETRQKMKDKIYTDEHRKKQSDSHKGVKQSLITIQKRILTRKQNRELKQQKEFSYI